MWIQFKGSKWNNWRQQLPKKNKHFDRNKIQCAQSKTEIGIQQKRKLEIDLEDLKFKPDTWSICLSESEGVLDVAYRQKIETKQKFSKTSVKWWYW